MNYQTKKYWIIGSVLLVGSLVGATIYYCTAQKNNLAQIESELVSTTPTSSKFPDEQKILTQWLSQGPYMVSVQYPTPKYADSYLVHSVITSPDNKNKAVLFGINDSQVRGIFIISNGLVGKNYAAAENFTHETLTNVRWQNNQTILYDLQLGDESGIEKIPKTLQVN